MFDFVLDFVEAVIRILEGLAALIVLYGGIVAFYYALIRSVGRTMSDNAYSRSRISLGRRLVVGLEFLLGADILRTAISPSWNQIGVVAAIVILRSALSLLLEHDIERLEKRVGQGSA